MRRSPFALVLALASQMGHVAQGVPVVAAATSLLTGIFAGRADAASIAGPEVVENWLLPRYDALVAAARANREAWAAFCAKPDPAGVTLLKERFGAVSDGWASVEFITFGPVMLSLRPDRMNLFPERRNAVGRSVTELIADPTDERLKPERFGRLSAAAQGLPALERLLYDEGAEAALVSGAEATRRCAIGLAIATNLETIATEIRQGWGDKAGGLLAQLVAGNSDPVFFPDPSALMSQIVTDLAGAYQRVVDQRLFAVLGKTPDDAKPLTADRRRSGRSKATIVAMITSADSLGRQLGEGIDPKGRAILDKALDAADAAAQKLPDDIGGASQTAPGRKALQDAAASFKAAQASIANPLAAGLGVGLGFNALDGD
ncbi:imelysin family protein [Ancylobacter oerskovii]|uniref:Imelysin family protein n=1 Tax=Ancylobacter oerskovii TaxID=459519 RepID=A0ABW4YYI1_9HYPH|nr:imelysin family protein [Ancylobacter oerskovii]MBS7541613.1 imelysin family protein [Ancylobacter oerskovii]